MSIRLAALTAATLLLALLSTSSIPRDAEAHLPDGAAANALPQGFTPFFPYDLNNDDCSDLLVRDLNEDLSYFPNTCPVVGFSDPVATFDRFTGADVFFAPGDWNRDGCSDVATRTGDTMLIGFLPCNAPGLNGSQSIGGNWGAFDFITFPGNFDASACPDIVARRRSDAALVLFSGQCDLLPLSDPVVISTGWGGFDWIGGAGPFDGDFCPDLFARATDGTMSLYPGDCQGGVKDPTSLGFGWNAFWFFIAGGNWDNSGSGVLACPDILAVTLTRVVSLYEGNCDGGFFDQNIPLFTLEPTDFHPIGESGFTRTNTWGDLDCDGAVTTRDNQVDLRFILQQTPLSQTQPCSPPNTIVILAGGNTAAFGDEDCDEQISTRDNQAKLRFILQQPPLAQTEPCPDVGSAFGF